MDIPHRRPYTFDRVTRIIITLLSVAGVFYLLDLLSGALLPFLVAWLIAYMLNPIVCFFQTKLRVRNRLLAIVSVLILISFLLFGIGWALTPSVVAEVEKTGAIIENLTHHTGNSETAPIFSGAWYQSLLDRVNLGELSQMMSREEWNGLLEKGFTRVWTLLSGSVSQIITLLSWCIVLLYLVFILLDYDNIIQGFRRLIPEKYRPMALSILGDVEEGMNRYFRGQSLIALLVGILFSIGFVIIGLPLAIPLGLFIGLLNLVPYLQIVGIIPTTLLCFVGMYDTGQSFWTLFALSMAVFAVVQTIQDAIITPRIMGKVTGLNPAIILLSLSIWGTLLGVMGMIIALPLTTLLLSYYKKFLERQEKK